MARNYEPLAYRLFSQVIRVGKCWEFKGYRPGFGYGILRLGKRNHAAHRVSYALFYGDIPEGKIICQKCDNPACVNPTHLYAGTYKSNCSDMWNRKRNNTYTKVSQEVVKEIRRSYKPRDRNGRSSVALARKFGISHEQVLNIAKGKSRTKV